MSLGFSLRWREIGVQRKIANDVDHSLSHRFQLRDFWHASSWGPPRLSLWAVQYPVCGVQGRVYKEKAPEKRNAKYLSLFYCFNLSLGPCGKYAPRLPTLQLVTPLCQSLPSNVSLWQASKHHSVTNMVRRRDSDPLYDIGLEGRLRWWSVCHADMKTWIQIPHHPHKKPDTGTHTCCAMFWLYFDNKVCFEPEGRASQN